MTRPDPLREMAESILIDLETRGTSGWDKLDIWTQALRTAHRQGQESMRSRAAQVCEDQAKYHDYGGESTWKALAESYAAFIRNLPTEPEGKDANVDSNVVYTGQCRHNIPYGQPCIGCQRS